MEYVNVTLKHPLGKVVQTVESLVS